jgi:hypothetical protein
MGETRFLYGFLKGLLANKPCPVQLEFLNPRQDKEQLLSSWRAVHAGKIDLAKQATPERVITEDPDSGSENWVKFEKPWLYFT